MRAEMARSVAARPKGWRRGKGVGVHRVARGPTSPCDICGGSQVSGLSLAKDHSHDTGKLRWLLCSFCNVGLGFFKDSPELLRVAAKYLEEHRGG
jgi:hypothetical protein